MNHIQSFPPRTKLAPSRIPFPVVPPNFDAARDGNPPPPPVALPIVEEASDRGLWSECVRMLTLACGEIGIATQVSLQQGFRLFGWGCCHAQRKRLAASVRQAQERLGARMELLGFGDPGVQTQLAELLVRQREMELKSISVRALEAERIHLWQQLADSLESQPATPVELASDREYLLTLRDAQAALDVHLVEQRQNLFPEGRRDQLRIAAAAGILCVLLLGGCGWMFSTPTGELIADVIPRPAPEPIEEEQDVPPDFKRPIKPNEIRKQEPERPVEKVQKVEKPKPILAPASAIRSGQQDFWVEPDNVFPRRRFVGTFVTDQPHGDTKCLDAKGRVICAEHYEHGVLNGKRTCFYPSGKKLSEMTFVDGVAQGTSTCWYESGVVAGTIELVDGQCTGESITYFPNGKMSIKVRNVDNVPHGEMLHFRPDGQCFAASDWNHGRQTGQDIQWDVTQQDVAAIEARARFSSVPVDWWP